MFGAGQEEQHGFRHCFIKAGSRHQIARYPSNQSIRKHRAGKLPDATKHHSLVQIIDEHIGHVATGVDKHPLAAISLAHVFQLRVEPFDSFEVGAAQFFRLCQNLLGQFQSVELGHAFQIESQFIVVHDLE